MIAEGGRVADRGTRKEGVEGRVNGLPALVGCQARPKDALDEDPEP